VKIALVQTWLARGDLAPEREDPRRRSTDAFSAEGHPVSRAQ
jgi:hypothetical protein